jgi:adenosylhomocysteine nucleosidase
VTVLAVTGLRAEAAIAARIGLTTICCGGDPGRTADALDQAMTRTVIGIVSFGIAGGLAPPCAPGTLLVADAVVGEDRRYPTDPGWSAAIRDGVGAIGGDIAGAPNIVGSAAAKASLFARSAAIAVDLESLVAARAADRAGLPLVIFRAIGDPHDRDLPPAALLPLRPDGRPSLAAVARSLIGEPRQLGALLRTAGEARRGLRGLATAALVAAPLLRRERAGDADPGGPTGSCADRRRR